MFLSCGALRAQETQYKEAYLKKLNDRIQLVLRNSNEANIFLGEDLLEASKILDSASIKWINNYSALPYLNSTDRGPEITLSANSSFSATDEQKVVLIMEILFQVKRQHEGSLLLVPKTRILLFARKFHPEIMAENDPCGLSVFPLQIKAYQFGREEFLSRLLSYLPENHYNYASKKANWVLWIEGKESTDGGCGGSNRNIMKAAAYLFNVKEKQIITLGEVTTKSCSRDTDHIDLALRRLNRKIKNNIPNCISQTGL
jgi:hypothetical protein